MRDKIVFLIHTNYHFLISMSIISEYYSDTEKYEVVIIRTYKNILPIEIDTNYIQFEYMIINIATGTDNRLLAETKKVICDLANSIVTNFFIFNEDEFIGVYLSIVLGRKGTKVCLAPDGLKAYAIITKSALKYRFFRTIDFYKFLLVNKLSYNFVYFFNIFYGKGKYTHELWLTSPDHSILKSKPLKKINIFASKSQLEWFKKIYNFSFDNKLKDNALFYISSIVHDNKLVLETEIKIINELQIKFPTSKIYLKTHPRTPKPILEELKKIDDIEIIQDFFPAEFYISELRNSIVLSSFSTASLYNNEDVVNFWLYPFYQKHIKTFKYTKIVNPTSHIKIINSLESINLNLLKDINSND